MICGEPRVAAECRCTEREFGWCARPTVRPGRTVHDDQDHGDGSDTRPRGRRTSGSLTETRVRDWQSWPERFDGSADRHMNPCPLDGTDQLARTVLAACVEPDGPVDADGEQALVIDDVRHPAVLLVHDPVPVDDRAARVPGEEPRPSFRDTRSSQGPPGVATSGAPSRRPPALVPDDRATVGSVWPMAAPVA